MINGIILVTQYSVDKWVKEALEQDLRNKTNNMYSTNGWTVLREHIHDHCECWGFNAYHRKLIEELVSPIYEESRKFLDL